MTSKLARKTRSLPKKTRSLKRTTQTVDKAHTPYDGDVPDGEAWRDGLILIAPGDAPDHPQFPKLETGYNPPKTFYAFNPETMRTECMVSFDAFGISIAWDMDRSSRYFLRSLKPLMCPRFVEYSYDTSAALKAGEYWSHSHKNYRGSLQGEKPVVQPDHRKAPRGSKKLTPRKAVVTGKGGKVTEPAKSEASKRPLRRPQAEEQPVDDQLLHDRGKMDAAAAGISASLSGKFGSGEPKRKSLKRKVRR